MKGLKHCVFASLFAFSVAFHCFMEIQIQKYSETWMTTSTVAGP